MNQHQPFVPIDLDAIPQIYASLAHLRDIKQVARTLKTTQQIVRSVLETYTLHYLPLECCKSIPGGWQQLELWLRDHPDILTTAEDVLRRDALWLGYSKREWYTICAHISLYRELDEVATRLADRAKSSTFEYFLMDGRYFNTVFDAYGYIHWSLCYRNCMPSIASVDYDLATQERQLCMYPFVPFVVREGEEEEETKTVK